MRPSAYMKVPTTSKKKIDFEPEQRTMLKNDHLPKRADDFIGDYASPALALADESGDVIDICMS
jgi:hypothetical protein